MTNYEYFFGNDEKVALLLMGDPMTLEEFHRAVRDFDIWNPQDPYVTTIEKEDGTIMVTNRSLKRWNKFLNTEIR